MLIRRPYVTERLTLVSRCSICGVVPRGWRPKGNRSTRDLGSSVGLIEVISPVCPLLWYMLVTIEGGITSPLLDMDASYSLRRESLPGSHKDRVLGTTVLHGCNNSECKNLLLISKKRCWWRHHCYALSKESLTFSHFRVALRFAHCGSSCNVVGGSSWAGDHNNVSFSKQSLLPNLCGSIPRFLLPLIVKSFTCFPSPNGWYPKKLHCIGVLMRFVWLVKSTYFATIRNIRTYTFTNQRLYTTD